MIIDFNGPGSSSSYKVKICIIGSGIIGLTILSEFLNTANIDAMVVESGGFDFSRKLKSMDEVINTGDVDSAVEGSRARMFGGTGLLWGGQILPFNRLDFELRDWVNNSGWPIRLEDLQKYYRRASNLLNLDNAEFCENIWSADSDIKSQINHQLLDLTFSKWSPKPNLGSIYKKNIESSKHITLLTNASVTRIELDESSKSVEAIELKSFSGNSAHVNADVFILCCGGIDNARILLASNNVCKAGIGNYYGNVGSFYQDHIGIYGGRLIPKSFKAFENLFSNFLVGKQKYLPKLVLSEQEQTKERLLNVNASISIQAQGDSPINNIKNFYSTLQSQGLNVDAVKSLVNAVRSPIELVKILNSYYIKHRKHFPRDAGYFLIANCETEPRRESYIRLTKEKDILGVPKAQVNWEISDLSKKTLLKFYQNVGQELSRLNIAEVKIKPELYDSSEEWKKHCYSLFHHIGATRMSDDSKMGVVNSDCKVHGVENLYIAGTSVFPTGGSANPTFTAMALALRLADKIKQIANYRLS